MPPSLKAQGEEAHQWALPLSPCPPGDPLYTASTQVLILADGDPSSFLSRQLPFLSTLRRLEDHATAYIYGSQVCSLPVTEPCELRKLLHQ